MSLDGAEKFELIKLETMERHQTLTQASDQNRLEELRAKSRKSSAKKAPAKKAPAKKATSTTKTTTRKK